MQVEKAARRDPDASHAMRRCEEGLPQVLTAVDHRSLDFRAVR